MKICRQAYAFVGFTLVDKKAFFDFALIDVVKRIEHNIKAVSQRRFCQRILVDFSGIKLTTGIQILTSGGGVCLVPRWMATQMLAKGTDRVFGR
jgi:DNA-binding transcriptional LysR family regulator